jgi:hypothetical protein
MIGVGDTVMEDKAIKIAVVGVEDNSVVRNIDDPAFDPSVDEWVVPGPDANTKDGSKSAGAGNAIVSEIDALGIAMRMRWDARRARHDRHRDRCRRILRELHGHAAKAPLEPPDTIGIVKTIALRQRLRVI